MHNDIQCRWLKDPKESVAAILKSETGASRLAAWLEHAAQCPGCSEDLDTLPEGTLNQLFGSESLESVERDDASSAADAVTEVLFPTLSSLVRTQGERLVERFGPYSIYASCEAVNSLFRRDVAQNRPRVLLWQASGDVSYEGRVEVKKLDVAAEIESITGLVRPSESNERVVGIQFYDWLYGAARDQPRLLSRFEGEPVREGVMLHYLSKKDAIADPAVRWTPRYVQAHASW